jgi:hypothetical protein
MRRITVYNNVKEETRAGLEKLKKQLVDYRHRGYDFLDIIGLEEDLGELALFLLDENVKIIKRKNVR